MMARKPAPALPDVFARPGAAPSRGTAIEDLPQIEPAATPEPEPLPEPRLEPELRTPPAPPPEPRPELVAPPPPSPPPAPPPTAADSAPPEPPFDDTYRPDSETRQAPLASGRRAYALAMAALVISLTAPFWEDAALSILGIRTPVGRAAEQSTLAAIRQDRRTEDISQRLAAAMAQITKQQAEFTTAMRRADQASTLIRTMALVRLNDTLRRPMPFAAELTVVRASGTDLGDLKPLLDQIEPYAATGIPGTTQLRQDFRTLYDQVVRGSGGGAASWVNSLTSWARSKPPSQAATAVDPSLLLLQTASARVAEGDIAGALEATRKVEGDYKPVFATWIDDAQARVAADALAERVSDMVTVALRPAAAK
jgi:hypothetical protein